jgi:hypothetical protein
MPEESVRLGEFDEVAGFGGVAGEGLLDHDRLPRLQGEAGLSVVLGVGRGDVHDVDLRVVHELLVGAVGCGRAVFVGEGAGPVLVAGADGDDLLPGTPPQRSRELSCDPAGGEDAPAQGRCGHRIGGAGRWQSALRHRLNVLRTTRIGALLGRRPQRT